MIDITIEKIVIMTLLCVLAGFIDSIAGGGGLVSLTSYYAIGLPPIYALGNNKFSSTFGTFFAMLNYARKKEVVWSIAISGAIFSIIGALLGAQLALHFVGRIFRYMLLIVLPILTFFTLFKPKAKNKESKAITIKNDGTSLRFEIGVRGYILVACLSFIIGVYDGFFGPGTGMFYTLIFSSIGFPMIYACGITKAINLASNIAAVSTFIINGNIIYKLGIPCMIASIVGNLLGSEFAIKKDTKVIKPMLLFVIAALYIKIIVDLI